jgi:hypothetical protein
LFLSCVAKGDDPMTVDTSVADSELPTLRRLAGELAAAGSITPATLDEIAALAAAIAGRWREGERQRLHEEVATAALAIYPEAAEKLQPRLADASLDELSGFAVLLDKAAAARTAFARADADLMSARTKGDYASMAPLAIEADTQKTAFAGASGEFAERIGLGAGLTADISLAPPVAAPATTAPASAAVDVEPPAAPAAPAEIAVAAPRSEEEAVEPATPEEPSGNLLATAAQAPSQSERRRIRDLIRQVRTTPDEAP